MTAFAMADKSLPPNCVFVRRVRISGNLSRSGTVGNPSKFLLNLKSICGNSILWHNLIFLSISYGVKLCRPEIEILD